jgi:hypothetical protein
MKFKRYDVIVSFKCTPIIPNLVKIDQKISKEGEQTPRHNSVTYVISQEERLLQITLGGETDAKFVVE